MELDIQPLDIAPLEDELDIQPLDIQPIEAVDTSNYSNEGRSRPARGDALADQIPGIQPVGQPTPEPSLGEKSIGLLEQIPVLASSMTAQVEAPVSAAIKKLTGMTDKSFEEQTAEDLANRTYMPRSGAGQGYAEKTGEFMNRYVMPVAPMLGMPRIRTSEGANAMRARFSRPETAVQAGVDSLIAKKVEAPAAAPARAAPVDRPAPMEAMARDLGATPEAQQAASAAVEQQNIPRSAISDVANVLENRNELRAGSIEQLLQEQEARRAGEAQSAIDARNAALEQDVQRQARLDNNAAERARQEAAPQMSEANRQFIAQQEQARIARDTQRMAGAEQTLIDDTQHVLPDSGQLYGDQYGTSQGMGRVDENGMPIRADLSMEAANLENPLQRNLWGDELGPALGQERSLTQAIDSMPSTPERKAALGLFNERTRRQGGGVLIDPELKKAALAAIREIPRATETGTQIVRTPEGFVAMQGGRQVGKLEVTAGMTPEQAKAINEPASVDIVRVDPSVKGTGVGRALYQAFNEAYEGNIRPSGKTTADAWNVWKRDFPEKVDQFVLEEAARLKDGGQAVLSNITDPSIAQRVLAAAYEPGFNTITRKQGGGIRVPGSSKPAVSQIEKIGAFKHAMRNVMPDNLTTPEFIAKHRNGKDIEQNTVQKGFNQLTKGGIYMAERVDNPLYTRTVNEFLEAEGRAKAAYNQFINEDYAPKARSLNKKDLTETWTTLKKMEAAGVRATPDELVAAGLTEKQVALLESHWNLVDHILPKINETMERLGMGKIHPEAAYVASKATGTFRKLVYKGDKVVGIVGSNSRRGLEKDLAAYLKLNPEYKAGPEMVMGSKGRSSINDNMMDTINWLANNDPDAATFLNDTKALMDEAAFKARGAHTHTMAKKGIEGMEGNKPWEDDYTNAKEGFEAQVKYARRMFEWAEKAKAVENTRELINSPELNMPVAKEMATDYMNNALGRNPTLVGGAIDDVLSKAINASGGNLRFADKAASAAREFVYTKFLKLDLGFLVSQVAQMPAALPEMAALIQARGGSGNAMKALLETTKKDQLNADALQYARDNHIYAPDLIGHSDSVRAGPKHVWDTTTNYAAAKVEALSRQAMFMTLTRQLHDSGIAKADGLFDTAARLTDMAMANYSSTEAPRLFQQGGKLGSLPYTLSTFKFNELSRLALMARELKNNKSAAPLLTALTMQVAKAGLLGTIAYKEAEWAVEQVSKLYGKPFNLTKWLLDNGDKKIVGPVSVQDVSYGLPGVAGVDMTTRMGMGELIPSGADIAMPGSSAIGKAAGSAYDLMRDPSKYNAMQAAVDILPGGRHLEGFFFDKPIKGSENSLGFNRDKVTATVERTPGEAMLKRFGMTSVNESREKNLMFQNGKIDKFYMDKQKDAVNGMKESFFTDGVIDPKYIQKFVENQGDPKRFKKLVTQIGKEQNIPAAKLEKMRLAATRSITNAYKLQRRANDE